MSKKLVSSIICIVMFIITLIVPVKSNDSVTMGSGNGTNLKITNNNELAIFLEGAEALLDKSSNKSLFNSNLFFSNSVKREEEIKSYTLHTTNFMRSRNEEEYTPYGTQEEYSNHEYLDKEMYVYVTEDFVCYKSQGIINEYNYLKQEKSEDFKITKKEEKSKASMRFDIEILMSADGVFMKCNYFLMRYDGEEVDLSDPVHWIDITDNRAGSAVETTHSLNVSELSATSNYFKENEKNYENSKGKYSLKDEFICEFMSEVFGFEEESPISGEHIIDLSDTECPKLNFTIRYNETSYSSKDSFSLFYTAEDILEFYNINNTFISFDKEKMNIVSDEEWMLKYSGIMIRENR